MPDFAQFLQVKPNQFCQLYQNCESNCYCDGINQWILTLLQFQTMLWFQGTELWCIRHCRHCWRVVECRTLLNDMFILLKVASKLDYFKISFKLSFKICFRRKEQIKLYFWLWIVMSSSWDVHRDTGGPDKQFNCCTVCRFLSVWQVRLLSVTLRWETK